MKMKFVVIAQTMSEGAVNFIEVKEDRHQNIISSVALKRESKNRGQSKECRTSLTCLANVRSQ